LRQFQQSTKRTSASDEYSGGHRTKPLRAVGGKPELSRKLEGSRQSTHAHTQGKTMGRDAGTHCSLQAGEGQGRAQEPSFRPSRTSPAKDRSDTLPHNIQSNAYPGSAKEQQPRPVSTAYAGLQQRGRQNTGRRKGANHDGQMLCARHRRMHLRACTKGALHGITGCEHRERGVVSNSLADRPARQADRFDD
jgi:hypothetical protein